jgi:hypothetical protein
LESLETQAAGWKRNVYGEVTLLEDGGRNIPDGRGLLDHVFDEWTEEAIPSGLQQLKDTFSEGKGTGFDTSAAHLRSLLETMRARYAEFFQLERSSFSDAVDLN